MPYKSVKDAPPAVQKLPAHAGKVWISAFNSAIKNNSESSAAAIAWSAVHKAGFGKDAKGKWGKGKGR